ncbi:MAG: LysR family transcriptional regulator [Hyphomicrobiales bacterium]|nr:LysR family transcriptional regulator [Hyphomicrobiales bacterium]
MTFEQLRIFVAVAERSHLTQASSAVGRTQSAVSAAIKAVETRYDVRLFDRVGRGLQLTAAGQAFLPVARSLLAEGQSAQAALTDLSGSQAGALTIAASQTIGNYWLPPMLGRLADRFPRTRIELKIGNTDHVERMIEDGEAEIGFIEGLVESTSLSKSTLAGDELLFVVGAAHRPPRADKLDAWLADQRWLVREEGSGTRAYFDLAMRRAGLKIDRARALVLPSNEAIKMAAVCGAGVAFVSKLVVGDALEDGVLQQLALPSTKRKFFMIRHRRRYVSKINRALADLVRGD